MKKRLSIIFILGFSSGLPLALITNTLQAWFADSGRSFLETGLLSLVGLPYIFCFILAPLVDRYSLFSIGKRRSWIALMQIILISGFNLMAWFTPLSSPMTLAWLALAMAFVSALQDIAINAHRTEYLPVKEHGLGASMAVTGYRIGLLVSGGLALIIAQSLGWAFAYRFMGFMMLFGLLAVYFSPEPSATIHEKISFYASFIEPVRELISRPRSVFLLLFVFFYKLGEAFTTTTSGIMMPFLIQYLGFSLDTIAYVNKIIGIGAIVAGGWVAGLILLRWSLYRALMVFGLIQGLTNLLFIALAMMGKQLTLFIVAVVCDNFAAGMGTIALIALFMRIIDYRFTATQFSILVAFSIIPRVFSGPSAAMLQSWFGWVGMYQIAFLLSLVFIPFLFIIRKPYCTSKEAHLITQ